MFRYVMRFEIAMGNKVEVTAGRRVYKFISHKGDLGEPEPREITGTRLAESYLRKARKLGFPC